MITRKTNKYMRVDTSEKIKHIKLFLERSKANGDVYMDPVYHKYVINDKVLERIISMAVDCISPITIDAYRRRLIHERYIEGPYDHKYIVNFNPNEIIMTLDDYYTTLEQFGGNDNENIDNISGRTKEG